MLVDSCLKKLATKRGAGDAILVEHRDGGYQLQNFSAKRKLRINKIEYFKAVGETSMRLKNCEIPGRGLTYQYFDCPRTPIHSDIEESTNKIDGAIVQVPACLTAEDMKNTGHHATNIAATCEWKVEPSEANKRKVSGHIPFHALVITNRRVRIMARSYLQMCKL